MKNLIQWLKSFAQKWDKRLVLTMVLFTMTIYLYYPDLINSILNVLRFSFYNPISQMFMLPAIITIGIIFINLILTVLTLLEKFLNQKIERFVFSLLCLIQVVLSSVRGYSTTNSMGYLGIRQRSI